MPNIGDARRFEWLTIALAVSWLAFVAFDWAVTGKAASITSIVLAASFGLNTALTMLFPRADRRALFTFTSSVIAAMFLVDWAGSSEQSLGRISLALGIAAFALAFLTATRPMQSETEEQFAREQAARAATGLSARDREDACTLVASGRFIEAVKLVRAKTGLGLNESKMLVEPLRDQA